MAEPTLKDVLSAIAEIRRDMATKEDVKRLDSKIEAARGDLEALDEKVEIVRKSLVSTRRDDVRDLRDDVTALHKGLVRASGSVPKDLPSQVREKGEQPSKPVAQAARRRRAR